MIKFLNKILKKNDYKKIFVITEERNTRKIKRSFDENYIYGKSYRSYKDDAFKTYPRKNHRYYLQRILRKR